MCDRGSSEARDGLHLVRSGDEVDRHRVLVARDGERRGLPGRLGERDEVRARDLAHVEAGQQRVREVDHADPEPVAACRGDPLDEGGGGKRSELTRYGARRHAGPPRNLVRPELPAFGDRVEDGEGPFGCANSTGGGLTSARHRYTVVADSGTVLLRVQF